MQVSWIYIFLYVLLMWAYAWHVPESHVTPWNVLSPPPHHLYPTSTPLDVTCSTTADCPDHHICFGGACVPVLLRGEECDPLTGSWSLQDVKGKTFAVCTCTNPHFITQKHFGGNCDVDVACGSRGRLNANQQCDCDLGYTPVVLPFPTCKRQSALETMNDSPCEPDEVKLDEIRDSDGFHPDYLETHKNKQCFKRPCTFDALSGRPIKYGRYEDGVGCACDPSRGLFGVRLDGIGNYVRGPGYTACASILTREPEVPLTVDVVTYFYMLNKRPTSLVKFRNVSQTQLQKVFQRGSKSTFVVGQEWPFDYAQYVFRNKVPYSARTRNCWDTSRASYWGGSIHDTTCSEWVYIDNRMTYCRDISTHLKTGVIDRINYYTLLYGYPVCRIESDDDEVPEPYRGRYVSNPFHMLLKRFPKYEKSNGLELSYREKDGWNLDFAEPYNLNTYSLETSHVPDLVDKVVEGLESESVGVGASDLRERIEERRESARKRGD